MSALGYTDSKASLKVTTPLGADKLLLRKFSGEEAISAPFLFSLSSSRRIADLELGEKVAEMLVRPP